VTWVLLLLLAVALVSTALVSRRPLEGKAWLLLRCLFPAWRFFEQVELGPELRFRFTLAGEQWSEWQPAVVMRERGLGALLLNAEGNLTLAQQSLVEQLAAELDGCSVDAVAALVPYRLVQRLVSERARAQGAVAPGRYQFSLGWPSAEPAFISEPHEL
jgi:hypothetical protein